MMSYKENIENYERWLFRAILIGSVSFWIFCLAADFFNDRQVTIVVLDFVALLAAAILLTIQKKYADQARLIKVYCLIWLPLFIIQWKYHDGMNGSFSYAYFSVLIVFLGLLEKRSRLFMVLLLCLINIVLTLDHNSDILLTIVSFEHETRILAVNYLLHSSIVAALVVFVKTKFDLERRAIEIENVRLDRANAELSLKNDLLTNQQRQIRQIQNNLEELVRERTEELENRNKELEAYAYDNAHLVRRPLSNILSLLDLIKDESSGEKLAQKQLTTIQKNAEDLDEVVMKINMILK